MTRDERSPARWTMTTAGENKPFSIRCGSHGRKASQGKFSRLRAMASWIASTSRIQTAFDLGLLEFRKNWNETVVRTTDVLGRS